MTTTDTPKIPAQPGSADTGGLPQAVRDAYAGFGRGDLDPIRRLLTEDCTWYVYGDNPLAGQHRGWDQIVQMLGKGIELTDGTLGAQVDDVVVADERRAVGFVTASSTRKGHTLVNRQTVVYYLRDGAIEAIHFLNEDPAAHDEHLNR
jgi:ketosteroid isomerase-like protein